MGWGAGGEGEAILRGDKSRGTWEKSEICPIRPGQNEAPSGNLAFNSFNFNSRGRGGTGDFVTCKVTF